MSDTPTKGEVKHLQQGINWSFRQLKPFRENDFTAMKQYVGSHYSNTGAEKKVPFSLLELAVGTYTQRISGGKPRALVTTPHRQLYPQKAKLQRGINHLLEEIKFHETLAEIVQGAFFSMGIGKKGIELKGSVKWNGFTHDLTQPFFDSVTLDNWVHDMSAKRWDKTQFCGDRLVMDLEDAKEIYGESKKLQPLLDSGGFNQDRTHELSQGSGFNREFYREQTEVWEIWDPKKERIVTLTAGDSQDCDVTGEFLDSKDYNGPEGGPYDLLRFYPIRGNVMPVAPVGLWIDFHSLANNVMRKLERQAKRQKTVTGIRPGGEADGTTVIQANDGDMVKLLDPRNVANLNFPGVEPQLVAFLIQIKNMASWLWGNLDALGGLSPQSETLGQDRLLAASASQRLVRMQNITLDYTTGAVRGLGELLYTDPFIVLPQTKRWGNVTKEVYWTPKDREADFLQYNMKVEPYSLQYRSPSERLETIRQTMIGLMAPFAQQMAAQGIHVDFEALFKIIGEYTGMPEFNEILLYTNPRGAQEGPVRAMQSPVTSRTNTRINKPGATSQGQDEAMIKNLLGQGQQQSQLAQVTRPTG